MSRRSWYFVVALAFALHNIEEAIAAPRMLDLMQSRGPGSLRALYSGIDASELRISLLILTTMGLLVIMTAARSPTRPIGSYVMLVFAAFIGLNALAHVALTVAFRAYMPGLLTALVLTLPISALLLARGRREHWVSSPAFWTVLPVAVLIHGPVLAGLFRVTIGLARALARGVT